MGKLWILQLIRAQQYKDTKVVKQRKVQWIGPIHHDTFLYSYCGTRILVRCHVSAKIRGKHPASVKVLKRGMCGGCPLQFTPEKQADIIWGWEGREDGDKHTSIYKKLNFCMISEISWDLRPLIQLQSPNPHLMTK